MILDPTCIGPVCAAVPTPDFFFNERHQILFRVLLQIYEKNIPIGDGVIIKSTLESLNLLEAAGGLDYLAEVCNSVPSAANAAHYASIVREKAMLRGLILACTSTLRDVYDSGESAAVVLDRGEKRIFDIAQQKVSNEAVPLTKVLHETFEILDRNQGEHFSGVPSGFIELDNLTSRPAERRDDRPGRPAVRRQNSSCYEHS